jgi:GMP synthase (glutamine-hydrolysing)
MRVLVFQHVASAPLAEYAAVLADRDAEIVLVDCEAGDAIPATLDEVDGVISLGGPMSLYAPDGLGWLAPELELIRHAVATDVPFYGVCLGAQLLALAFGGRVHPGTVPEVGPAPVHLLAAAAGDPLLGSLPGTIPAFHWHADTFELPAGATLLASSERYPNQVFRMGAAAYGVQFHAESSLATVRGMTELDTTAAQLEQALGAGAAGRVLAAAERELPAVHAVARRLMGAWLDLCAARAAGRAAVGA